MIFLSFTFYRFIPKILVFFTKSDFFHINSGSLLFFIFSCFYYRFIATCFVIDLLQLVVMSWTISLFMDFHFDSSYGKIRFNKVIISNHINQYIAYMES